MNELQLDDIFSDSVSVAEAALRLALDRCNDLRMNPVFTFLIIIRMAEKNAEHIASELDAGLSDELLQIFASLRPKMEEKLNCKINNGLDLQRAIVDVFLQHATFKMEKP